MTTLTKAQAAYDRAARAVEVKREQRDAAIREALASGSSVREVVADTGLSRERVYQIRDDRR